MYDATPASPGADPEAWTRGPRETSPVFPGRTLLMEAAQANDLAAVNALLPVSDLHARDVKGRTALHHACETLAQGAATVNVLLAAGADPHALCEAGMSPIMYACQEADLAKVNALWDVSDLRGVSKSGHTLLVLAAWATNGLPVVQRLLPVCDPQARSFDQAGLLHHAQDPAVMDWLLAGKIGDPNARDQQGNTPLMRHVEHNRAAQVDRLLPVSDLMAENHEGHTALHKALGSRCWKIARTLAIAMPAAAALNVLRARTGINVRRLERAVVDAEQAALRAAMNEPDRCPTVTIPESVPSLRRARL